MRSSLTSGLLRRRDEAIRDAGRTLSRVRSPPRRGRTPGEARQEEPRPNAMRKLAARANLHERASGCRCTPFAQRRVAHPRVARSFPGPGAAIATGEPRSAGGADSRRCGALKEHLRRTTWKPEAKGRARKCAIIAALPAPARASRSPWRPGWRNGRRSGLKIRRWQHREGSSPSPGTTRSDAATPLPVPATLRWTTTGSRSTTSTTRCRPT